MTRYPVILYRSVVIRHRRILTVAFTQHPYQCLLEQNHTPYLRRSHVKPKARPVSQVRAIVLNCDVTSLLHSYYMTQLVNN